VCFVPSDVHVPPRNYRYAGWQSARSHLVIFHVHKHGALQNHPFFLPPGSAGARSCAPWSNWSKLLSEDQGLGRVAQTASAGKIRSMWALFDSHEGLVGTRGPGISKVQAIAEFSTKYARRGSTHTFQYRSRSGRARPASPESTFLNRKSSSGNPKRTRQNVHTVGAAPLPRARSCTLPPTCAYARAQPMAKLGHALKTLPGRPLRSSPLFKQGARSG